MAAATTTPAEDQTTVLDVLSGNEPIKSQLAITTTWQTVIMVVAALALGAFVWRYLKK